MLVAELLLICISNPLTVFCTLVRFVPWFFVCIWQLMSMSVGFSVNWISLECWSLMSIPLLTILYRIPFCYPVIWPVPIMIGTFWLQNSMVACQKVGRLTRPSTFADFISANEHLPDTDICRGHGEQNAIDRRERICNQCQCFLYWMLQRKGFAEQELSCSHLGDSKYHRFSIDGLPTDFTRKQVLQPTWRSHLPSSSLFLESLEPFSLVVLGRLGRFTIYFAGLCTQCVIFAYCGWSWCSSSSASWGVGVMLWVLNVCLWFGCGSSLLLYCCVKFHRWDWELKTVTIARNAYNIAGIIGWSPSHVEPRVVEPAAKTDFSGLGFYVRLYGVGSELPETGKTFFRFGRFVRVNKIGARKFKSTEMETFNVGTMMEALGDEAY